MRHYLVWILAIALYTPLFFILYSSQWKVADYTHAYFILPIFFWLLIRKRSVLKNTTMKVTVGNNFIGFIVLFFGISMFIFGWRQGYIFLATLSLLPVLYGLISCLYGTQAIRVLFFPILYLSLLVPIPTGIVDNVTLPLRYAVSIATDVILKTFSYPMTREGLLLSIGNHELFMGQPCSGFRSLITMFSLTLVYVYISKGSLSQKIILVFSIIPLSIFGNLFRVITVCLLTYYFGEEVGQGFFHNFSGIIIFVMIIVGLIGIESFLGKCLPHANIT